LSGFSGRIFRGWATQTQALKGRGGKLNEAASVVPPSQGQALKRRGGRLNEAASVVPPSQGQALKRRGGKLNEAASVVPPSQTRASEGLYWRGFEESAVLVCMRLLRSCLPRRPVLRRGFIDCGVEGALVGDDWCERGLIQRMHIEDISEQGFARH
jgi:hypothetical protein